MPIQKMIGYNNFHDIILGDTQIETPVQLALDQLISLGPFSILPVGGLPNWAPMRGFGIGVFPV
jgi:hypothetical protein